MELPNCKSIRLSGYDYSQYGYYFVTLCTENRQCLFGSIVGAHHDAPEKTIIKLNETGIIIQNIWQSLSKRFSIYHDIYQIMPNHVHGVIIIKTQLPSFYEFNRAIHESPLQNKTSQKITPKRSLLSQIVGYFKMNSSKQIRILKNNKNFPVWQRNYYEHIIRNETELNKIREYIKLNPVMWEIDRNNPASLKI